MSRERKDKGDTEMNVHGGEIDDVELDPKKERSSDPVRTRRVNIKDREGVAAEEMYQTALTWRLFGSSKYSHKLSKNQYCPGTRM